MNKVFEWTCDWAKRQNLKLWQSETTTSTNDVAKQDGSADLYLTAHQTAGRGRSTHSWQDSGSGELLSTWKFELDQTPQHLTAPHFGLALFRAASALWPDLAWSLKAPNDLFLGEKKVAGLLCETISSGKDFHLLIGLGFDVFATPDSVPEAGALIDQLESELTSSQWILFLDKLYSELKAAAQACVFDKLSAPIRSELCEALNAFPMLTEKYLEVDELGNMKTKTKSIAWQTI